MARQKCDTPINAKCGQQVVQPYMNCEMFDPALVFRPNMTHRGEYKKHLFSLIDHLVFVLCSRHIAPNTPCFICSTCSMHCCGALPVCCCRCLSLVWLVARHNRMSFRPSASCVPCKDSRYSFTHCTQPTEQHPTPYCVPLCWILGTISHALFSRPTLYSHFLLLCII